MRCVRHFYDGMKICLQSTQPSHYVLGVSGGVDSMVMAHLMRQWVHEKGGRITAIIVDHRLRDTSTSEAHCVQENLGCMGIDSHILTNPYPIKKTGIQEYARSLRYGILYDWCYKNGGGVVCVAHHYLDVLETVALRLERGSHLYGLAGINRVHKTPQGTIFRPMLSMQKSDIVSYADTHNIVYVRDPSNENTNFSRVRVRKKMESDSEWRAYLAHTHTKGLAFRQAMDKTIARVLQSYATVYFGAVCLQSDFVRYVAEREKMYIVRHILSWVSGDFTPARTQKVKTVLDAMNRGSPTTLHGCYVRYLQGAWWIWREPYAIQQDTLILYQDRPCDHMDYTQQTFSPIPKLVRMTLPVQVKNGGIYALDADMYKKYAKKDDLFIPPPFIFDEKPLY